MTAPPFFSAEDLKRFRAESVALFRQKRMEEPLEDYLEAFDDYLGVTEELLEATVDLKELEARAIDILTNVDRLAAFRYLAAPPISQDDLKTVAEVKSLAPGVLRKDAAATKRLVETVMVGLDRRRFPWIQEGREPTETERGAAVLATAALLATQRVGTDRRNLSKRQQEQQVEEALIGADFRKVPVRPIATITDAPEAGEFCGETMLAGRKADFVISLHDQRILALECKVSNSELNSLKRLNNDAAIKAKGWRDDLGAAHVVSAAMLSGVYKLSHLESAQARGITLFWAHRLPDFIQWIQSTRPAVGIRRVAEPRRRRDH